MFIYLRPKKNNQPFFDLCFFNEPQRHRVGHFRAGVEEFEESVRDAEVRHGEIIVSLFKEFE